MGQMRLVIRIRKWGSMACLELDKGVMDRTSMTKSTGAKRSRGPEIKISQKPSKIIKISKRKIQTSVSRVMDRGRIESEKGGFS